jgi:hypothetical protein
VLLASPAIHPVHPCPVQELKERLTAQQCPTYGAKAELQQRLVQALVANDCKEKPLDTPQVAIAATMDSKQTGAEKGKAKATAKATAKEKTTSVIKGPAVGSIVHTVMQLKISELREELTQLGLPALGNKTELRGKLLLHITKDMKGMLYLTLNCCSCAHVA